jgi:hypothetical protein
MTLVPQLDIPGRVEGTDLRDLKTYLNAELIANGGVVVSSTGRHRAMSEADNLLHGDNRFPAQYAIYNVNTEIYEYQNGNWASVPTRRCRARRRLRAPLGLDLDDAGLVVLPESISKQEYRI